MLIIPLAVPTESLPAINIHEDTNEKLMDLCSCRHQCHFKPRNGNKLRHKVIFMGLRANPGERNVIKSAKGVCVDDKLEVNMSLMISLGPDQAAVFTAPARCSTWDESILFVYYSCLWRKMRQFLAPSILKVAAVVYGKSEIWTFPVYLLKLTAELGNINVKSICILMATSVSCANISPNDYKQNHELTIVPAMTYSTYSFHFDFLLSRGSRNAKSFPCFDGAQECTPYDTLSGLHASSRRMKIL